jgi:hypothetical protein
MTEQMIDVPCREGISNIRFPIEGLERANRAIAGQTGVLDRSKEDRGGPAGEGGWAVLRRVTKPAPANATLGMSTFRNLTSQPCQMEFRHRIRRRSG